jgi:hypothetical protein
MNHFTTTMLACGIMLAALPPARADSTTCPPNQSGSTVNGNLIVPAGQNCQLSGVTVTGNVLVQTNATLNIQLGGVTIVGNVSVGTGATLRDDVNGDLTIDGNFNANQCLSVNLDSLGVTTIFGTVQFQRCTEASVVDVDIGGNVVCNNSGTCQIAQNRVKNGNVAVNDNSNATVGGNTIGNNLVCQGNTSITNAGFPNTVGGHKNGQCAGF